MALKYVFALALLLAFAVLLTLAAPRTPDFSSIHARHVWTLKLDNHKQAEHYAAKHNLVYAGHVGILPEYHLFEHAPHITSNELKPHEVHAALSNDPTLQWVQKEEARQHLKRYDPGFNDPVYSQQWHLHNSDGIDVGVLDAWKKGYTGQGLTISIVDDGVEWMHDDFKEGNKLVRFMANASKDWNDNVDDPRPKMGNDNHGTRCAGLASGGAHNGKCGVGSAFNSKFSAQRLISKPTSDSQEAAALTYGLAQNDIYTNSWGPTDDGKRMDTPGVLTKLAMKRAIETGRNGKGTIYVWAGGNGALNGDNVNYDGYANSIYTIAIGAVDNHGKKSSYSEPGAPLICSAPSSPPGMYTIMIHNACGGGFGGTSAAAPLAAGVIALVMESNPNLTWRDLQDVLVRSATKNDASDSDWTLNGAGLHINHKYGYGLLNGGAAVARAEAHVPLVRQRAPFEISSPSATLNIPDGDGTSLESHLTVSDDFIVEHVEIIVRIVHPRRGELSIVLQSPFGTSSVLFEPHGDAAPNIANWTFTSMRLWGEASRGTWTLKVTDSVRSVNRGDLLSWRLIVHGRPRS